MEWIDLRSDTVTMPTQQMREAMFRAEVGDNVFDDDPAVRELERLAADLLGKEAALFVSSGTQGNAIALLANTARGDCVIMSRLCHIADHEAGSYAMLAGVSPCYPAEREGILDPDSVASLIQDGSDYMSAKTGLICLENALSNGNVAPVENFSRIYEIARGRGVPVHLDGARLFHAAAALGVEVTEITRCCDTVLCCLSKGLCAPVGSVVAGSREFVAKAWKWRKVLGGGMRQAGFLAEAGKIALTQMTKRVAQDNETARYLARRLSQLPGVELDLESVKVNMVFFRANWGEEVRSGLAGRLLAQGIKILPPGGETFRFVTHHDISQADCDTVVEAISRLI